MPKAMHEAGEIARENCSRRMEGKTSPWRNCLLNLRTFGFKVIKDALAWRYPRERLLNALPRLLWESDAPDEPRLQRLFQKHLRTRASDWVGWVAAYKSNWPTYG